MRLLLDTHILLWWMSNDRRLTRPIRAAIQLPANDVAVSAVTFWEIAIKKSLGRIDVDLPELIDAAAADGFEELPARGRHAAALDQLPPHHRDPFDRLLLAQAIVEQRHLVTRDASLLVYEGVSGLGLFSGA